jgi:hypothetical protein
MRTLAPVALVLVAGLALTACTGGDRPAPHASRQSTASVQPPPTFGGVQRELPSGDQLHNDPALFRQVTLIGCTHAQGGWRATGEVSNTASQQQSYRITVFFTDAQARTVDYARAAVDVRAGGTATWSARRDLPRAGIRCVVRAVTG